MALLGVRLLDEKFGFIIKSLGGGPVAKGLGIILGYFAVPDAF